MNKTLKDLVADVQFFSDTEFEKASGAAMEQMQQAVYVLAAAHHKQNTLNLQLVNALEALAEELLKLSKVQEELASCQQTIVRLTKGYGLEA